MDTNRYLRPGYVPSSEPETTAGSARGRARNDGIRRVRRMSNWTAAALLVGTGATTVALASQAYPASTSGTATASSGQGTAVGASNAPHVNGAVVTSGGSGATVTTTTHVVNGKTVVTQVRHPAVYHDN
jgi:hypothetical protein